MEIDKKKVLGRRKNSIVFEGTFDKKRVAVKRIQLIDVKNLNNEEDLKNFEHPNVIKVLHSEEDEEFRYYVLELCATTLKELYLKKNKYKGPSPLPKDILLQLAAGLEYIHDNQFVHRDIKPANVFIWVNETADDAAQSKVVLIKLGGFSLCKQTTESGSSMSNFKGTSNWLAPLTIQNKNGVKSIFPRDIFENDIFALGLVFAYVLLQGKHPYGTGSGIASNLSNNNPVNLNEIPDEYQQWRCEVIDKMLKPNPEERLKAGEVVQILKQLFGSKISKETPQQKTIRGTIIPLGSTATTSGTSLQYLEIGQLTPDCSNWVLKATLVFKSNEITKTRKNKHCPRLYMKFKDDSGEIQAVAFLEFDFKLDDILQLGALYEISNATVQKAYKAKNRYEMLINQNTKIKKLSDDFQIPVLDVAITKLCDLSQKDPDSFINVEAVVIDMDDIVITPKKKMHKRDIYVTDDSLPVGNKVKLTLFKEETSKINPLHLNKKFNISNCKVTHYNQSVSLEAWVSTTIELTPGEEDGFGVSKRKMLTNEAKQPPTKK